MIRALLTAGIALSAAQHALAQDTPATPTPPMTGFVAVSTDDDAATRTFDSASQAERSSHLASYASSRASVSSLLGPFYETALFLPGVMDGDWVSAIGSGGPNDETTTYQGYMGDYYTDPAERFVYANMTLGPNTYIETVSMEPWTLTDDELAYPTTMLGRDITTRCSHTVTMPKISIPDEYWSTMDYYTLNDDHFGTYAAVCVYEGESTARTGISQVHTTVTMDENDYATTGWWRIVTVVGELPSARTATATPTAGGDAQTGSGSGTDGAKSTSTQAAGASEVTAWVNAVVVVAAAAAMAI